MTHPVPDAQSSGSNGSNGSSGSSGSDRPSGPTGEGTPGSRADTMATVILLIVTGGLAVIASFFGMFMGMMSDGCSSGDDRCLDLVGAGTLIATAAPAVCWVGAFVLTQVRFRRGQNAAWVPLLAVAVWFALVLAASGIASLGVD